MAKEHVIGYSTSLFWNKDLLLSLCPCWNHDSFPIIHQSKMRLLTITFYSFFMTNYVVDDGSGTISCCKWHSQDLNTGQESYDLGQLVTVQGKISVFREQRQLTIDLIYPEKDPNAEVLFWLEAVNLGNTVYKEPFTPSLKDFQTENSSVSKETELKKAILTHIKENKIVTFQFQTLCFEPDIQQLAREAAKQKCTSEEEAKIWNDSHEAKKVIRHIIKDLEKDGLVYLKDSRRDLYQVISHEHNLGSAILKAMSKIAGKLQEPSGFSISKWAIIDVLHSSNKFQHVTMKQVEESLDKLLQNSDVYKQSENEYCLV
ncbi:CST complex subunit STN1-like isoform X1 [Pocillopora damicornis]|uniref:CST complex subunit STN1-like isoform X1 n=1 Tax=Pocillopora damicornis TaxID=46731 RepID=UPI000F557C81|nr:CST complex subunit STN1-like isoform X1 [Pocillopora damicornis]